jgi:hypothetical protein
LSSTLVAEEVVYFTRIPPLSVIDIISPSITSLFNMRHTVEPEKILKGKILKNIFSVSAYYTWYYQYKSSTTVVQNSHASPILKPFLLATLIAFSFLSLSNILSFIFFFFNSLFSFSFIKRFAWLFL